MNLLEWAQRYLSCGWRPIPVPYRKKRPTLTGWPDLRLTLEDLPRCFGGSRLRNIGVLLGEPSGWLVDIDLDHLLAVEWADRYLPVTPAVFGRLSKPRSHRIYLLTGPVESLIIKGRASGTIVELRSSGLQTVFPPSIHESDEAIEWENPDARPVLVDPAELRLAVQALGSAVLQELGDEQAGQRTKKTPPKRTGCAAGSAVGPVGPAGEPAEADFQTIERCLASMLRLKMADGKDGSRRLFAAACRAVGFGLSDQQAIACMRTYEQKHPFPKSWSDEEILKRVRDAEKKVARGAELEPQGDDDRDNGGNDGRSNRASHATMLVNLCRERHLDLLHDGDVAYASLPHAGGIRTLPVRGRSFKLWLSRLHYEQFGAVPGSQAITDAVAALEGKALFDGPEISVHVRLAGHAGNLYLDLADQEHRVVEVSSSGWQVVQNPPVRFRRPKGLLPLPVPVQGGSLDELKDFINLEDERTFVLAVAWLIAALVPGRPTPILAFNSEQGSGKTTASRILRGLVDPNMAPVRCEPREPRDLMIMAANGRVVALDNLSRVSAWLSDALCRLSTGGGFSTRVLFTDDEEQIFNSLRPVILNGIEELGTRSDLLDRTIRLSLPSIPEERRLPERVLFQRFEEARPRLLGALLRAVGTALGNLNGVTIRQLPRMADFALLIVAAEAALPWKPGQFMAAYAENRHGANELAIESSIIGEAMQKFALAHASWQGNASSLLAALNEMSDAETQRRKDWPSQPHLLSGTLRRLAPNLRALGVNIDFPNRSRKGRLIIIRSAGPASVTSVTERHNPAGGGVDDAPLTLDDAAVTLAQSQAVTRRDAGDALLRPESGGGGREVADL